MVTFRLPAWATEGQCFISATDAATGDVLEGGYRRAHSWLSPGEVRMLLPKGEYFISCFVDQQRCSLMAGKFQLVRGSTVLLNPSPGVVSQSLTVQLQRDPQSTGKPEKVLLGTLTQDGQPVMKMFGIPNGYFLSAKVTLPLGSYRLVRPNGESIPIEMTGGSRKPLRLSPILKSK